MVNVLAQGMPSLSYHPWSSRAYLAPVSTPPSSCRFHLFDRQDRSIEVDVQTMLCADAFATSRSTLGELTMYHTRAKTIFLSSTCDGYGSTFGHTSGRLISARSFREEAFEVSRRHVVRCISYVRPKHVKILARGASQLIKHPMASESYSNFPVLFGTYFGPSLNTVT